MVVLHLFLCTDHFCTHKISSQFLHWSTEGECLNSISANAAEIFEIELRN